MVIDMNEAQVRGLEQVREVLEGTQSLEFRRAEDDQGRYAWIEQEFAAEPASFKIFVLHHHLLPVPGTGRERNVVYDAGEVDHAVAHAAHRRAGVDRHCWTRLRTRRAHDVLDAGAGDGRGRDRELLRRAGRGPRGGPLLQT